MMESLLISNVFSFMTVKTEKVDNPYGSVAGAGSGDFHVYRHARSREMERWKKLDEEEKQEELDQEFKNSLEANRSDEELKTAQRRKKRQRQKDAKQRKRNLQLSGVKIEEETVMEESEFTYTSIYDNKDETVDSVTKDTTKPEFANDGSFLKIMKQRLAEESETRTNRIEHIETEDDEPLTKRRALNNA